MCKTLCRKRHTCPCEPRKRCPGCFTWLLSVSRGHPGAAGPFWAELSRGRSPGASGGALILARKSWGRSQLSLLTCHTQAGGYLGGREDGTRHCGPEDTPANDLPCGFE